MKILWISRHVPLAKQIKELGRLFGEIEITLDYKRYTDAKKIMQRFKEGNFDDIVLVAPRRISRDLSFMEIFPLSAEMRRAEQEESDICINGLFFKFVGFKRPIPNFEQRRLQSEYDKSVAKRKKQRYKLLKLLERDYFKP
jgi:hypothetical protein